MKSCLLRLWEKEDGVLSFEWVLLLTVLVIGVVGGLTAARDAIIDEFGDAAQAMLALDQSFTITQPLAITVHLAEDNGGSGSGFVDAAAFTDCTRNAVAGQADQDDVDS